MSAQTTSATIERRNKATIERGFNAWRNGVFFDAKGTARDGKPYANTYAWFLDMRGGRVTAAFAFFDSLEFNELWARVTPAAAR